MLIYRLYTLKPFEKQARLRINYHIVHPSFLSRFRVNSRLFRAKTRAAQASPLLKSSSRLSISVRLKTGCPIRRMLI